MPTQPPIRFVIGNINTQVVSAGGWDRRLPLNLEAMVHLDCSIWALQETNPQYDQATKRTRSPAVELLNGLKKKTGANWGRNRWEQNSVFYNLDKWTLVKRRAWKFDDRRDSKIRGLLLCELESVKYPGVRVHAGASHFSPNVTGGDQATRNHEAHQLGKILQRYPNSVVGVDFNDHGGSRRILAKEYGVGSILTTLGAKTPKPIDDYAVGPGFRLYRWASVENKGSDHGQALKAFVLTAPKPLP